MSVIDLLALSLIPFERRRTIGDSLRQGRDPADILQELLDAKADSKGRTVSSLRDRAAALLRRADERGLSVVPWSSASYPSAVAAIFDPPPVLWVRGRHDVLERPAVAIVGSRSGSPYALAVARRLAADLAARGIVVVSGLARGVDSAAHRGALETGVTVAVLGTGVDVTYPAEHRTLADSIAEAGAVLSELAPGTGPRPYFFPLRNRIISSLSRAVVVVEAGEKSGSLITARCALEQGRDVLAVPGNVLNDRNRGGHALIRDGAKIVESADDILEELGVCAHLGARAKAGAKPGPRDSVVDALVPGEACDLDTLAERSGVPAPRLLSRLFELELQGRVARAGGGRFVLVDRTC